MHFIILEQEMLVKAYYNIYSDGLESLGVGYLEPREK